MKTNYFVHSRSCFLLAVLTIFSMAIHATTITLDAQNGTVINTSDTQVNIATYTITDGTTLTLPDAICTLSDCTFMGWSQQVISATAVCPTIVSTDYTSTEDITLYAVYQQKVFTNDFQTITVDENIIEKKLAYDTYSFQVVGMDGDTPTGDIFTFVGYYSTNWKPSMNMTDWNPLHYFGNKTPIPGLESITLTSGNFTPKDNIVSRKDSTYIITSVIDSTYINDTSYIKHNAILPIYQLSNYVTTTPSLAIPIDSVHEQATKTFDFISGQGNYFFASPREKNQCEITKFVITAKLTNTFYNSNPSIITVTANSDQTTQVLTQHSFVSYAMLEDLISPIHSTTFMGWSNSEIATDGSDTEPAYTSFPIFDDETIYAVYKYNNKYYTTIPDDVLTLSGNDAITNHTNENFTSIIVGKDITLDVDETIHLNTLTINTGAKVTVNSTNFSTKKLHIIGQDNDATSFTLPKDESISTSMDYSIVLTDNTRYHFFSLPYTCNYNDIVVDGGTLDNIGILKYDPSQLADGHSDNWVDLETGDILLSNVGYCIATDLTSSPTVTFTPASSTFNFTNDNNKTIELQTTTGTASTEYQGWNLVGSPYIDAMGSGLYRKPAGISFVSKPNFSDNCWTYTQTAIGDATIEAFSSYFVQVGETTDMTFEFPTSYVSGGPLLTEDRLKLSLSNLAGETDPTYIDVQTQYTTDYEIGRDLRKMLGQGTRPQFFSLSGQEQRAFNAIPETAMNNIPLGIYTGTTDQYTITADNATRYNASHLYLTDLVAQSTTDLMISPYTFTGTAQTLNTSRFVLNIVRNEVPTTCDPTEANGLLIYAEQGQLSIQNIVLGSQLDIIDATGKIVYHRNVTSTSLNLKAATGLYIIRITLHDGSFTSYKTIL